RRDLGEDCFELLAFAYLLSDFEVATVRADTGRDEVAQSTESEEGLAPRAHGQAQARDLRQAAREQGGLGVVAEAEPVAETGGDGDDILDGRADLDAGRVGARIDAE